MFCGTELWSKYFPLQLTKKVLDNGQEVNTYPDLPQNLYDALQNTASKFLNKTAIVDNYDHHITYGDLKNKVDKFSSWLSYEAKVTHGAHVALMLYNSLEFCVAFIALIKLGAVTIPLPTKYKEPEVKSLIEKSDVQYIITDQDFVKWFTGYEETGTVVIPSADAKSGYGFEAYQSKSPAATESEGNEGDTALLMFTSGTTSQSKGVLIKNYSMMHAIVSYQKTLNITAKDISIIPIPIYHITGLVALLGLFIWCGGTLYLHKYFNAERVLNCIRENKVTFLHASPTVFSMLLKEADKFPDLPSLKKFACGSGNMPKEKLYAIHKWLPDSEFHTVYGLTETTSPATIFPGDAAASKYIGSSGLPIPGTYFKIVDENHNELLPGQVGEIWISGSVVLETYYNFSPSALADGWLGTGDLGYFNEDGYLFVVDRMKDMINRGGEKIWSFDVENEIYKIRGVEENAVIGIPDDIYGEAVAAVVILSREAQLSEAEIQNELKGKMAKYKIPTKILILDEMPVTPNGKIDKKKIKQLFIRGGKSL